MASRCGAITVTPRATPVTVMLVGAKERATSSGQAGALAASGFGDGAGLLVGSTKPDPALGEAVSSPLRVTMSTPTMTMTTASAATPTMSIRRSRMAQG